VLQKRMYKVICPIERNGSTFWMRLGSGFTNKDESINIYLDAVPVGLKEVKLQLREYTEEELKQRAEKRSSYAASHPNHGAASSSVAQDLPF